MQLTPTEKLNKLQRLFDTELRDMIFNANVYIKYKQGYDTKMTYEEVMERGKKAYEACKKFEEAIDAEDLETDSNRFIDLIVRGY